MKYFGYKIRPDGNYQKICEFPQGKTKRIEVIIRDSSGKLIRVLHGKEAGKAQSESLV